MDKNTKTIEDFNPEDREKFSRFRDQMLIVLIKRLGGSVKVSVEESNDTGSDMLMMESDPETGFVFKIEKKTHEEKTAVIIESWKLPVFKKALQKAGFEYKKKAGVTPDTLTLIVKTNDTYRLKEVAEKAHSEALRQKMN